jgi:hypothetical protein
MGLEEPGAVEYNERAETESGAHGLMAVSRKKTRQNCYE